MRTFLINRSLGSAREIPVTSAPGYGAALAPEVVERYRAAGLLSSSAPEQPRKPAMTPTREALSCMAHGLISGDRCPSGCSRRCLQRIEVPLTPEEIEAARRARPAAVLRAADGTPIVVGPARDTRGRFLREPPRQEAPEPVHADERMTESDVRIGLKRLMSHLPRGGKKPLARLCGYTGKWALHSLRGVAKGRAMLPDRCRRRISSALNRIKRGDLVLIALPGVRVNGDATHEWRVRTEASERQAVEIQL